MKKYTKLFIFTILACFLTIISTNAKQVNLDELGKEIDKVVPDASSAYIIGDYVFTSQHTLTTQDLMLAARSINLTAEDGLINTTPSYGKMTIQRIVREYDDNADPIGWQVESNALGSTKLDIDKQDKKINIKYIDYHLVKEDSTLKVDLNSNTFEQENYKKALSENLKISDLTKLSENLTINDKNEISGLLLKYDIDDSVFPKEEQTGYYFPFVLEVPNANSKTQITITGKKTKTITFDKFDVTEKGKEGIVILWSVDPNNANKTITITIDLDGEGEVYDETTYTIDYSKLKFQEDSQTTIEDKLNETAKNTFNEWGYSSDKNADIKFTTEDNETKISGKLVEQVLKPEIFGADKTTGYYFTFTFVKPEEVTINDKMVVYRLKNKPTNGNLTQQENIQKTFAKNDFEDDGSLTILYRFPENQQKCESNGDNCKLYYVVDYDGDGKEYLPTLYVIDYSELTFEKASLFEVTALESDDGDFGYGWSQKDGYYTQVEKDPENANTYKVSGVLPIFEDEEWGESENPFDSTNLLYYLGLHLTLTNPPKNMSEDTTINEDTIDIKFFHDTDDETSMTIKLFDQDFYNNKDLYILKALKAANLDGSPVDPEDKYFTITIDLDGEESDEYAPYTVTIDYSELKFQDNSLESEFDLMSSEELSEGAPEKKELDSYGFKFETVSDVKIKENNDQPDREPYKEGIEGTIKEQTLNQESGFTNLEGYFVPIKISVPKDEPWFADYTNSWELILNTESGNTKTYKPTTEEYNQGWVMVLFKITEEGKNGVKSIKYSIDYDGASNTETHTGDAFLPYEYEIKYDSLTFESEDKLTYTYKDNDGNDITEEIIIYEGEKVVPKDLSDKNTSYRTFDKWTNEDGEDVTNGFVPEKGKDVTLTAHWTLDADAFLNDVIADLADPDSEISEDYSNRFTITKDGNTITIDVKDATMLLSEMDETTIPGTIAYILDKGEITDITLSIGNKKVTFTKDGANNVVEPISLLSSNSKDLNTLKDKIQAGAAALFTDVFGNVDALTLNKMAVDNSSYTLSIGNTDNTVNLKDIDNKTYTVKFTTKATAVKSEEELKTALENENIETITIANDFDVKTTQTINRKVTISSAADSTYTITAKDEAINGGIFNVSTVGVKINNIKFTAAKTAITVGTAGSLTINKVDLSNNTEAGIEVKGNGSLTATELTMSTETYNIPAIRAEKTGNAIVRLTDEDGQQAQRITKQEITKGDGKADTHNTSDSKAEDMSYQYYNYYNTSKNSEIYEITFRSAEGRNVGSFVRYAYYGMTIPEPPSEEGTMYPFFKSFNRDGNTYTNKGYSLNSNSSVFASTSDGCNMSDSVIKPENLKAAGNATYYVAYCITPKAGTAAVNDAEEFKEALKKAEEGFIEAIYINSGKTIDLSSETLKINHKVSIVGKDRTTSVLKVGGIEITVDDVVFEKLTIEGAGSNYTSNGDALIYAHNDTLQQLQLTLWQVNIKNSGSEAQYAVRITDSTEVIGDIRWSTFDAPNIKNYIFLEGPVANGTDFYINTFKDQTSPTSDKGSDIIIKSFATGDDDFIRVVANTFSTNRYAMKILKEASGKTATIESQTVNVAVEYDDSHNQFGNIQFKVKNPSSSKAVYLKDGKEEEQLSSGTGIKFIMQVEMVTK